MTKFTQEQLRYDSIPFYPKRYNFKIMLVNSNYIFNKKHTLEQVTKYELIHEGYIQGGQNIDVINKEDDKSLFGHPIVCITKGGEYPDISYAIIYTTTRELVSCMNLSEVENARNITIEWHKNGIYNPTTYNDTEECLSCTI